MSQDRATALQPGQHSARVIELYNTKSTSEVTGVSSGYPNLDHVTAGLQRGDLIIIAGRPSMGKTSFALNIAENVGVDQELPVAVFSMEMGADQLAQRMISSVGRIDAQKLRKGHSAPFSFFRSTIDSRLSSLQISSP